MNIASGNKNCYRCGGKQFGSSSKELKIKLPYDIEIPLLSIYPKELETGSRTATYTTMFIARLFTVAKKWKQTK